MTVTDVFEGMDRKFRQFGIRNVHGVFQFDVGGPGGGQWHAVCSGDRVEVRRGRHPHPDVSVTAQADSVIRIAEGRLKPTWALMTRKIKVKGNMALAYKMNDLLSGKAW